MIFKDKANFLVYCENMADKWDWSRPLVCKIAELRRKEAQSSVFHAMVRDISKQAQFSGTRRTEKQWKHLLVSAHQMATSDCEAVTGLEGEMVILNRESTSDMSIKRMSSLIDYTAAWSAGNGVIFSADDSFLQYPEAQKHCSK